MNNAHRRCINNGCQRIQKCDGPHDCELNAEISAPFDLARTPSPAEGDELPPLPEAQGIPGQAGSHSVLWGRGYTAEQMRAYARAAQANVQPKDMVLIGWQYRDANDDGTWGAWLGCDKRLEPSQWRQVRGVYAAAPDATQAPAPAPATAGLRKAAQDVLDRWNSPKWEWAKQGPTADLMAKLREELEASPAPAVEHLIPQGFRVEHCAPWGALTDEANARTAWLVERTEAPYSGLDRQRKWSGPTLADAMRAARESLPADIFDVPVQGTGGGND